VPRRFIVALIVRDSLGMPVADADASVLRGLNQVRGRATTDANGRARIILPSADSTVQLVVRRVGFAPDARFLATAHSDSIVVEVRLRRLVVALDSVRVTAAETAKRKSYFIDADAISASRFPLYDALDILTRLRPDMLKSRAPEVCADSLGRPPGARTRHPPVGGLANIWVNGKRIRLVEMTPWVAVPRMGGEVFVRREMLDILKEIRPEHIEEITYTDCFDTSVPGLGTNSAAFVTLKTGIGYERGRGSYVLPRDTTQRA
jgi:hypothetical protein